MSNESHDEQVRNEWTKIKPKKNERFFYFISTIWRKVATDKRIDRENERERDHKRYEERKERENRERERHNTCVYMYM